MKYSSFDEIINLPKVILGVLVLTLLLGIGLYFSYKEAYNTGYSAAKTDCVSALAKARSNYEKSLSEINKDVAAASEYELDVAVGELFTTKDRGSACRELCSNILQSELEHSCRERIQRDASEGLFNKEKELPEPDYIPSSAEEYDELYQ